MFRLSLIAVALTALGFAAQAASYPVSGRWTYDNADKSGPAKGAECTRRYMEFAGERRFDTGGGVPDYRNLSVEQSGASYTLVDEFLTGQIRARSRYTLRLIDDDHLEVNVAGHTIRLRRCA